MLAVEPDRALSYTWEAFGLESVVTWTLTPTAAGTRLRMEQTGFRPDQEQAYQGAQRDGEGSSPTWSRCWPGETRPRSAGGGDDP
ncbi:MAG: SRPBCC domain-containing protein [Caulobacteraceae bacterium]